MAVAETAAPMPIAGLRVAAEIRAEIARRDTTQKQLAAACYQSQPWVSRRLSGEVPLTLNDAEIMARGLGLSIVDLVQRAYTPQPGGQPTRTKVGAEQRPRLVPVPTPTRVTLRPHSPRPLLQMVAGAEDLFASRK